jgi:hypothetical protein
MLNKPLNQVQGAAAGAIATLKIQPEDLTLVGVKLALSGTTFNKTHIDRVRVKVGARVIWDLTYAQLNKMNNYKTNGDSPRILYLDFCERDQALFPLKQVGGLDLQALLLVGEVYIEIYINGSAVAPVIQASGYFERPQNNPLILKYLGYPFTNPTAGRFTLPLNIRGAFMKRVWLHYTGTDFTGTTNGNIERVEIKKNGIVIYDQSCLDARFDQIQFKKVPQSNCFVIDFMVDNNADAYVATVRTENTQSGRVTLFDSFEFNVYLKDAGGATVTAVAELLDTPTNM